MWWWTLTGLVDTNVGTTLLVLPAGTVIVAGTVTAAVLLLENATTAPSLGTGAVSVTVAEAVAPPCTVAGLRLSELRAGAVTVHPDSRTLTGAAEPSFTSTVQSAGGVWPDRSILKVSELLLVVICTPSTVIGRLAVALPSIRNPSPLTSARETAAVARCGRTPAGRVAGSPAALGLAMAPQPPLCAAAPSHWAGLSGEPSGRLAFLSSNRPNAPFGYTPGRRDRRSYPERPAAPCG